MNWFDRERKEHFAFISTAGFTIRAVEFARDNGVLLFELKDMGDHFR